MECLDVGQKGNAVLGSKGSETETIYCLCTTDHCVYLVFGIVPIMPPADDGMSSVVSTIQDLVVEVEHLSICC